MAQADELTPTAARPVSTATLTKTLTRVVAAVASVALLAFIALQARTVYDEWSVLQGELSEVRKSSVIGYPGVHPAMSYAERPRDWYRRDGEELLLWGGWRHGVGHSWFRVKPADLDLSRMSLPTGRDNQRAIDTPIVETGGGSLWSRVPDEAVVAGGVIGGVETAYPVLILDKVVVVNDLIKDRPFLITYNPQLPDAETVEVYEPVVGGRRVTMGVSGYFHSGRSVLYDRGTESLWVHRDGGLQAVSGTHKGVVLKTSSRPERVEWQHWRSKHPNGRLVVGADRTATPPQL